MTRPIAVDRHWLLTFSTYGTRLPGDARGFVSNVRDGAGPEVRHNAPGTPFDADLPGLEHAARARLAGPPVRLCRGQAEALLNQFRETVAYRGWVLRAAAILDDHVHLMVGVPGDPDPADLLRTINSYAGRALNRRGPRPAGGTWWTESASRRVLREEREVRGAMAYIRNQPDPLLVWIDDPEAAEYLDLASGGCEPPDAPGGWRMAAP